MIDEAAGGWGSIPSRFVSATRSTRRQTMTGEAVRESVGIAQTIRACGEEGGAYHRLLPEAVCGKE